MWKILGMIFVSFAVAHGYRNETFPVLDILKILESRALNGISETCNSHLEEYLQGVTGNKIWALQMFDSITKFPDGVLIGHMVIPGHFDECVQAASENFKGKHCMAKLGFKTEEDEEVKKKDGFFPRKFSYGICVPSTCNGTEITNAFSALPPEVNLEIEVADEACSTDEFRPLRTEDWTTIAIVGILVVLALASTCYEVVHKFWYKKDTPHQLWTSFSFYNGGKQLFRISQSTAQLKCLHGFRFLSMTWVILGHAYFSFLFGAAVNSADIPKYIKSKSFVPVSNAFVSVDSFFFLSGLLVCLVFFRDISKKGTFDVPVAFIHRYLRLTPPFALLTLIQATVISRIGNGPFWNERIDLVEKQCRKGWWTGLLYVQNYVEPTSMCLGQAWYLSADMQMYWVSPLILYPLLWFPSLAPYFILILVLAATITNFTVAFVNHLQPNFSIDLLNMNVDQFKLEYVTFHTRMAPWIVGLATGYVICGLQAKKIRINMSKLWVMIGWAASFALLGGSVFGILSFYDREYSDFEAALYLSLHRVGWALGLSWIVIACVAGYGGPINHFLSLDIFQPLAKLSYCNFLIHMTLQNYRSYTMRTNSYLRHFEVIYSYFGDLIGSHLIAIPVVLLFEFPFSQIDRFFFQKLQIFPLPKPKKKVKAVEQEEVKEEAKPTEETEKLPRSLEEVENGKVNPAFTEL